MKKQCRLSFSLSSADKMNCMQPSNTKSTTTPREIRPPVKRHDEDTELVETLGYEDRDDAHEGDKLEQQSQEKLRSSEEEERSLQEWKRLQRRATFTEKNRQKYAFLDNILDENRNPPSHPNYDPRTLFIPQSAFVNMTPFERQYWEIKRKHFDTILFFQKGKFYELFETDAEIGQMVLGLKMTTRVNMRMVGLPATHFNYWAAKLVALGYKVAKVEQVETPLAMAKRQDKSGARDATDVVCRRELKQIITPGSVVDEGLLNDFRANFLLSIAEDSKSVAYGICFVDCATAEFTLGYIQDDSLRTQFQTLLFQIRPREILFEKNTLSSYTMDLLRQNLVNPVMNPMSPKEWWDAQTTIEKLTFEKYFRQSTTNSESESPNWPPVIREYQNNPLAMSALGGCISFLHQLMLDEELVSLRNFKKFDVLAHANSLILDGRTLLHLEVLENDRDMGTEGTLLEILDHCQTPFGKRLLRKWLCHPLRNIAEINDRLNAVEDLIKYAQVAEEVRAVLAQLSDLPRAISRIHAGTASLSDFIRTLDGFQLIHDAVTQHLAPLNSKFTSQRLKTITNVGGEFPDCSEYLRALYSSFDKKEALETGILKPRPGFDPDYDEAVRRIQEIDQRLQHYLRQQQAHFKSTKVVYREVREEPYQIEVPLEILRQISPPLDYEYRSGTQSKDTALNTYERK
jgi:DNA mismatch repair protein MSH6